MPLTDEQIELYSRQIILRELGGVGQRRLLAARVLLRGGGPAFDAAASYLVGAGVGGVDLEATSTRTGLALAPLAERNPDVRPAPAPAEATAASYDVLVDAAPGARPRAGAARFGEIAIRSAPGRVEIAVVPAGVGCVDCAVLEAAGGTSEEDPIAAAQAGCLAALAALRWLAGIGAPEGPRRLTLEPHAPAWAETTLGRSPACPRPCRP